MEWHELPKYNVIQVSQLIYISPSFVFRGQLWLVYIGWYINCFGLFVMDSNGWYIFQFCLSRTIFVRILPSFVCHGQLWLEYIAGLSVADNIDWFITRLSLSWTILGGIFNGCVLLGQYWLVNQPFFFFFHGQ